MPLGMTPGASVPWPIGLARLPSLGQSFPRVLAAIIIANFLTLVVANLLEVSVLATPPIYLLALALALTLVRDIRWRREDPTTDRWPWIFAAAALVLQTVPRIAYVLEWIPGNCVVAAMDDYARVPEVATMVLSARYPLQHPANPMLLFSFFYATLYPMAVLKLVLPVLTIKDCIFLGNLLYHGLLLGSFVGMAQLLLRDRIKVRVLVFLVSLFGGLDWLMNDPMLSLHHAEWWQPRLHGNSQISSYYTGMVWAVHHFAAFFALVLAYVILFHARVAGRFQKRLIVLLLLAAAMYSSPFSVMSVPLFAVAHWRVVWRRLVFSRAMAIVFPLALVPAFIFCGKPTAIGFTYSYFRVIVTGHFWVDKLISLPIYMTLVPLVEFGGIPFLLIALWGSLRPVEKSHFAAAAGFFLMTYLVAFIGANDLCMRGMLLPTFVLFALFARHFDRVRQWTASGRVGRALTLALMVVAACGVFGTLKEAAGRTFQSLYNSTLAWDLCGRKDLPPDLQRLKDMDSRAIVRDPRITTIPYSSVAGLGYTMYSLEKLIDRKNPEEMERGELELARYPRRGFFR